MARFRKQIEKERIKKNYGILSRLRDDLHIFYPDYNPEEAFDDILNNRDTLNADICYALSTIDNYSDIDIDLMESMLAQLYVPITQDTDLLQRIVDSENLDLLDSNVREIIQCLANFTHSYDMICKKYEVGKKEITPVSAHVLFPYFNVPLMSLLRRQAFRCILSIKDLGPYMDEYLEHLDNDGHLLNICEIPDDKDIQLLLMSYIELHIDINNDSIGHICRLVLLPYYYFGSILRYSYLYSGSICSYHNRETLEENKALGGQVQDVVPELVLVLDQVLLLMILAGHP
jgi:hypothetical protein